MVFIKQYSSTSFIIRRISYMVLRALLPTAFLPQTKKDPLGESWTHADGVIGHFNIGNNSKGDLSLTEDASQFIVAEAKMYSKLSSGVTHAKYYDQAARNVACIAEVLRKAEIHPDELSSLGFYVLAPESQISSGVFKEIMSYNSIESKVKRRVEEYGGEKNHWYGEWFKPTLAAIKIDCISWEKLIEDIEESDATYGKQVRVFYDLCKQFNKLNKSYG
jgi:hypothetical protein